MKNDSSLRFMHNFIEAPLNDYINLLHVGWEKCMPEYTYVNHRNVYLIHFVKKGKGFLQIENMKYDLSERDIFLIRPNRLATYTADKNDPWEYYYFAFDGKLSEELLNKTCFSNDNICASLKNDDLSNEIKKAVTELNDQETIEFSSLQYIFKFFSYIAVKGDKPENKTAPKKNYYISTLEEYIMFNYSKPLLVSELSKMINLNRSHLHRVFKKHTGRSIEEFIIYVRMQEAKRFLRETDFSIIDISHLVGYVNYQSFFRTFKKSEGITPTE